MKKVLVLSLIAVSALHVNLSFAMAYTSNLAIEVEKRQIIFDDCAERNCGKEKKAVLKAIGSKGPMAFTSDTYKNSHKAHELCLKTKCTQSYNDLEKAKNRCLQCRKNCYSSPAAVFSTAIVGCCPGCKD